VTDEERYYAAAHAMQSGVAFKMEMDPSETVPKHLRVGVNSAMSNMGGLVTLLISKGVITHDEYIAAIADAMERERDSYRQWLIDHGYPSNITLG
jgi:hypothetical protein